MSEEVQEEIEVQGPGAVLKARRESLQLSIEEIAEKLHLRPAVVTELENDIIDHSVSITFTKGYVRLYAKHLEIDPEPLLAAFDALANPIKQPAKLQSFSQRVAKQASDTRLMILSYSILFVIIAMAVIWWFQQPDEDTNPEVTLSITADEDAQPVPGEPELLSGSSDNQPSTLDSAGPQLSDGEQNITQLNLERDNTSTSTGEALTASEQALSAPIQTVVTNALQEITTDVSSMVDQEPIVTEQESNDTERGADAAEPVNDVARELAEEATDGASDLSQRNIQGSFVDPVPDSRDPNVEDSADFPQDFGGAEPITQELVFTFAQECWMNLTDATGENIAYGVKNAGRVMPVSGIPPFEVVLGAPQGVAITLDGVPFDMSAFPAGRTARFTIGDQSSEQPSASEEPSANEQPSANEEPSASDEPSASEEPSANEQLSADIDQSERGESTQ